MESWMSMLRSDPDQAIRMLLGEHGGLLYYAVRGVLQGFPEDDIEECVTDVLMYVWRNRNRLKFEPGTEKSYLVKAARHIAIDKLRRADRLPEPVADPAWEETESDRSAEEAALAEVERKELIASIRRLGEPDATILLCKYYIGMKSMEIAELLGMKENTVVQRACRAVKKLAEQWKGGQVYA